MGQIRYFKVNIEKDDLKLTTVCKLLYITPLTQKTNECVFEDLITEIRISSIDDFEEISIYQALEMLKTIIGVKLVDYVSKIKSIQSQDLNINESKSKKNLL